MGSEQREFERVPVDYPVEFRVPGSDLEGTGRILDLSTTGVQFHAETEIEPGTEVSIRIPPLKAGTPPLLSAAAVVRCQPEPGVPGFTIACAFD